MIKQQTSIPRQCQGLSADDFKYELRQVIQSWEPSVKDFSETCQKLLDKKE